MKFASVRPEDATAAEAGNPKTDGPRFTLRIVGIARSAAGIAVRDQDIQFMFLTRAWTQRFGSRIGVVGSGSIVRLRRRLGRVRRVVPRGQPEG